jgi:hypothetical protein
MSIEPGDAVPARVRQHPQVVSSRLGDGGVLVHLGTNRIFELNATGFRIWELIGQGLDPVAIVDTLEGEFTVARARLRAELDSLVASLLGEGLLDAGRDD